MDFLGIYIPFYRVKCVLLQPKSELSFSLSPSHSLLFSCRQHGWRIQNSKTQPYDVPTRIKQ